ncbi:hypothetical protein J6590_071310 [Homalodisca vitripennis]|nr:hypothetical protein J6590_071310 [Homalodisca vitripennis]
MCELPTHDIDTDVADLSLFTRYTGTLSLPQICSLPARVMPQPQHNSSLWNVASRCPHGCRLSMVRTEKFPVWCSNDL